MFLNKIHKKNTYLIIGLIFIIFWLWPLWNMNDLAVVSDGNLYLQNTEAFKIAILEFSQIPQNNPWIMGGKPQSLHLISPLSIKFWIFMAFETKTALSVYMLFAFMLLLYGSYKIASYYFKDKNLKYFFALLSIFNIALIFHLKAGHYIFLSFCYFPLILYFLFKHRSMKYSGVFSGYLFGMMLDDDFAYMSAYCIVILGFFIIYFFRNFKNKNRQKLLYWCFFFILTALSVICYKLNIFYEIRNDFPRSQASGYLSNIFSLLKSYLIPYYKLEGSVFASRRYCTSTWENSVYIGLVAFIFIFFSFKNKFNTAHYIVIFLFLLQLGTLSYLPYGLLANLPIFESHYCFNRVRVFNSFYLSFLIIYGFSYICKNKDLFEGKYSKLYEFRTYILVFILIERLFTSHLLMYDTHKDYKDVSKFSRYFVEYKNYNILDKYKNNKNFFNYSSLPPYEATKQNIGVMRYGGDSFFSYNPYVDENYIGPYAVDEKEYQGEFTIDGKMIKPDFWSPNVIIFNNLEINKKLNLNMNPNKGWTLNGDDLFINHKVMEHNKKFVINVKESSITLKYEAPGKNRGIIMNFLILFILLITIYKFKNSKLIK